MHFICIVRCFLEQSYILSHRTHMATDHDDSFFNADLRDQEYYNNVVSPGAHDVGVERVCESSSSEEPTRKQSPVREAGERDRDEPRDGGRVYRQRDARDHYRYAPYQPRERRTEQRNGINSSRSFSSHGNGGDRRVDYSRRQVSDHSSRRDRRSDERERRRSPFDRRGSGESIRLDNNERDWRNRESESRKARESERVVESKVEAIPTIPSMSGVSPHMYQYMSPYAFQHIPGCTCQCFGVPQMYPTYPFVQPTVQTMESTKPYAEATSRTVTLDAHPSARKVTITPNSLERSNIHIKVPNRSKNQVRVMIYCRYNRSLECYFAGYKLRCNSDDAEQSMAIMRLNKAVGPAGSFMAMVEYIHDHPEVKDIVFETTVNEVLKMADRPTGFGLSGNRAGDYKAVCKSLFQDTERTIVIEKIASDGAFKNFLDEIDENSNPNVEEYEVKALKH